MKGGREMRVILMQLEKVGYGTITQDQKPVQSDTLPDNGYQSKVGGCPNLVSFTILLATRVIQIEIEKLHLGWTETWGLLWTRNRNTLNSLYTPKVSL